MYSLISFKANGERIESVNEVSAFYALVRNGMLVEYFTTLEALHIAVESLKAIEATELDTVEYGIPEFKIAA
jgi:hypothetical protein